jgi:hypothetical protein
LIHGALRLTFVGAKEFERIGKVRGGELVGHHSIVACLSA